MTLPKGFLKHEDVLFLPTSICSTDSLPIPLVIPWPKYSVSVQSIASAGGSGLGCDFA